MTKGNGTMLKISKLIRWKVTVILFIILNNANAMDNRPSWQNTSVTENISYQNDSVFSDFIMHIEESEYWKFIEYRINKCKDAETNININNNCIVDVKNNCDEITILDNLIINDSVDSETKSELCDFSNINSGIYINDNGIINNENNLKMQDSESKKIEINSDKLKKEDDSKLKLDKFLEDINGCFNDKDDYYNEQNNTNEINQTYSDFFYNLPSDMVEDKEYWQKYIKVQTFTANKIYEKVIKDSVDNLEEANLSHEKYFEMLKCNKRYKFINYDNNVLIDKNVLKEDIGEEIKCEIEKNTVIDEYNRVFIQSDTEGKLFNILIALYITGIIDLFEIQIVYYDFLTGNFEVNKPKGKLYLELHIFKINEKSKVTYIHLGDIVDRCGDRKECLISLLTLLYVKQVLGDKIKLICGNHEIGMNYVDNYSDCCSTIKPLIMLIVFKAIAKGQIVFFDRIKIGKNECTLTHKVLFEDDIDNIKNFICNKTMLELNKIHYKISELREINKNNEKDQEIKNILSLVGEKESEMKEIKDFNVNKGNIEILLKSVNTLFKKHGESFFELINEKNSSCGEEFLNTLCEHFSIYNVAAKFPEERKNDKIVGDTRANIKNLDCALPNQYGGHDHLSLESAYSTKTNVQVVDNCSGDEFLSKANIYMYNRISGERYILEVICEDRSNHL